jgi:hypothetical protein
MILTAYTMVCTSTMDQNNIAHVSATRSTMLATDPGKSTYVHPYASRDN